MYFLLLKLHILSISVFGAIAGGGSPGETPRRSARLSSKGRLSSDSIEGEADAELVTSKRAKRQVRENGKDSSPKTQAKNGGETKSLTNVPVEGVSDLRRKEMTFSVIDNKMGRDFCLCMFLKLSYLLHNSMMKIWELMSIVWFVILAAGKDELIQDAEKPDEKVASEEHDTVGEEAQKPLDETVVEKNGEVEKEKETEEPNPMDVDAPLPDSKDIVAGDSSAKPEETIAEPLAAPGEDVVVPVVEETKLDVPTEAVPDALVAEEEKVAPEAAVVADLKPEETEKEQVPTDQVDPPQPHGVHALVDNAGEVGGGPKPEGEVSQAPVGAPESTLEPVV